MFVKRGFNAPQATVWQAWTEPSILDQWWAPKPWKTNTKSMDFRQGGRWLYSMNGPDGEVHWSCADYIQIDPMNFFEGKDGFTDENGIINPSLPVMIWRVNMKPIGQTTEVTVEITFPSKEAMDQTIQMGFKEGFTMAHGNLDELLGTQHS
jgi:uncharacterized protein YndB with AHSA1/START domain